MIRITSPYLKDNELSILRRYCNFVMNKLVSPYQMRNSLISIKILKKEDLTTDDEITDFKKFGAWMFHDGLQDGKKQFRIILSADRINKRAKKLLFRVKQVMYDLAHELTHVKQYLNNEVFDYKDGRARYKGEVFGETKTDEEYYNSPWEIEAYGREHGMFRMYQNHLKKKLKK